MRLLRDGCTIAIEDEKNGRKKTQMLLQDIDSVMIANDNSLVINYSYRGMSVSPDKTILLQLSLISR